MILIRNGSGKVARHRERQRAAGLRLVQVWVPDTRNAGFAEQVRRQCVALNDDPAEADALCFAESAASDIEGWE